MEEKIKLEEGNITKFEEGDVFSFPDLEKFKCTGGNFEGKFVVYIQGYAVYEIRGLTIDGGTYDGRGYCVSANFLDSAVKEGHVHLGELEFERIKRGL